MTTIKDLDNQLRADILIIKAFLDVVNPGIDEYVPDDEFYAACLAVDRALDNLGISND